MQKDKQECDCMLLIVKEEIPYPTIVEEKQDEYANEEEQTMGRRQDEEQHQQIFFENVMVGIDKYNVSIDLVILGKEEDKQVVSKEKPFGALSRAWIDTENGEMTLLVVKENVKFNLHQSIQMIDEERNNYKWI